MIRKVTFGSNLFQIHQPKVQNSPDEKQTLPSEDLFAESAPADIVPVLKSKRIPAPGEPLAYCSICKDWTPMQWRPVRERGKRAEQWFQCEYCGCRELTLRYLSGKDAVAKNQQYANRA